MQLTQLFLRQIRTDGGTQTRVGLDLDTVEEYVEALKAGCVFPPIIVFFDGKSYWIADGWHRLEAHRQAGMKAINVDLRKGTQRDAILFACQANVTHGLKRSNADKRKAVLVLLGLLSVSEDLSTQFDSERKIAKHCGVSHSLVQVMKSEAAADSARSGGSRCHSSAGAGGNRSRQDLANEINEEERRAILAGAIRRSDDHLADAAKELEDQDLDFVAPLLSMIGKARGAAEKLRKKVG